MLFELNLIGNVGTAENKVTQGGQYVTVFSVAVNEKTREGQKTTWVRCSLWGKDGNYHAVSSFIRKGDKIYVSGKPQANAYTDKQGAIQASLELLVNRVELLGGGTQEQQAHQPVWQREPGIQQPVAGGYSGQAPTATHEYGVPNPTYQQPTSAYPSPTDDGIPF